jgi:hypothetical protein
LINQKRGREKSKEENVGREGDAVEDGKEKTGVGGNEAKRRKRRL